MICTDFLLNAADAANGCKDCDNIPEEVFKTKNIK